MKLSLTWLSLIGMRYWTYLTVKLAAAAAVLYGLLAVLNRFWPSPPKAFGFPQDRFGYDLPYTAVAGLWFLLCAGALYLVIWDQRYRCRECLRRLRMPVETGSWSRMLLLGRPRMEYICPYGHGTLKEAELQILGLEYPEWTPNGGMWEELCAAGKESEGKS